MLWHYQRKRDLFSVGAFATGDEPVLDQPITLRPEIEASFRNSRFASTTISLLLATVSPN